MRRILAFILVLAVVVPSMVHADSKYGKYKKKGPVGIGGWVVFWDANNASLVSFEKHADQTDRAYCEWYNLQKDCMPHPVESATEPLKARAKAAAKANDVELWMMVGNYNLAINDHDKNFVEPFLYDGAMRAKHIQMLIDYAVKDGVQGIQIDYENFLAKDKDAFSGFMAELDKACKEHGFMCGVALPAKYDAEGTWDDPQSRDYKAIGRVTDQFVPMTYDYHWSTGTAGCVTSPEWAERVVKYSVTTLDADKMEVGYPTYGYDWVGKAGETITYKDFMNRAEKYHATPVRDTAESQELSITYTDEKGKEHEAWMPDSVSLQYQCDIVKKYHLYGIGIWMFGSEDESFWTTMKLVNSTDKLTSNLIPAEPTPSGNQKLKMIQFLTDQKETMYQYAYPETSKIAVLDKQNKRWADIKLQGNAWAGGGLGVDKINLLPYLSKGALQFYIRGNKGGEALSGVGFVMDTGLGSDEKFHYETSVPLGNYCNVTTKWQMVTIPLSDFPSSGHHFDDRNGQAITGPFKWAKVIEFDFDHSPGSDADFHIQICNVRVVPKYNTKLVLKEKEAMQQ
jgi:spore germination protein YaaH